MRELLVVLQREFGVRVRSRSFVLSTILTPIFLVGLVLGPRFLSQMGGPEIFRVVLIDDSGGTLGEEVGAALDEAGQENRYFVRIVSGALLAFRDSLNDEILENSLDAYVYLSPDVLGSGEVQVVAGESISGGTRRALEGAVSAGLRRERLREMGLEGDRLDEALQPARLDVSRLTVSGQEERSDSAIFFGVLVGFFLYFLIILFGVQVMQSVQEEKTNRIAEVLVSSIRASHLMLGKVLGVGSAALLQVMIWVVLGGLLFLQRGAIGEYGLPAAVLSSFVNGAGGKILVGIIFYTLFGFFLYATLFAAAGAAAASSEDAQRFTLPLIMPLIIPMVLAEPIATEPRGTIAVVLGWIPLTSPLVMPMRMGAGGATLVEVIGTLVVLALAVAAAGWLAGRIYRVGILSTGKRPSIMDLIRWARMA